ncbi:hypothetical protein ACPV5O_11435 [Vibrio maritimus]|jgi:hypothetical protein|uniref:Uncharacterized protein n=1 Tax=Vibrio chaetopteri TaxID=3016528 RepID=A0AAU8BHP1_9VIBR|nr:hypothetical protein [Vibrio variabilis]GMQ45362.1 hypothetical protein VB10N_03610 [Vibrio sp. 10N]GMQ47045.1 hypothetical protein VB10N_20440 [Vibrio sp. 10N]
MKATHKTMLMTIVVMLIALAVINNVGALKPIKEQINGNSGWF